MATFPMLRNGKSAILLAILAIALARTLSAGENVWTRIGPETGTVSSLAVDHRNPSTVYACAGGLFKTIDGGANWRAVNSAPPGCDIIIDPQNSGTVYALSGSQIFKTTNGGIGWSAIFTLKPATSLQALLIAPSDSNTLYASDGAAIFKSADEGATWARIAGDDNLCCGFNVLAIDPQNRNTIYANSAGLFKSTDGGASWKAANSGLPQAQVLAIDPQNPNTLYAISSGQIFKSTDGGASWNPAGFGLPPRPANVNALAVNALGPTVIYALVNNASLFTSTDGAASWTIAADPVLAGTNLNAITPDPQNAGALYLGTNNGVLKTADAGGHWNFANSGLRAAAIKSVIIDSRTPGTLFADTRDGQGFFKSTDGGNSWFPSNVGLPAGPFGFAADPQHSGTLYTLVYGLAHGSVPSGGLFQSQDGGGSWSKIWSSTAGTIIETPLVIAPQNPNVMYAGFTTNRIAKSADGGHTWTQPQVALSGGCCSGIDTVAVDPQDPNIVYAGTTDDDGLEGSLWKSTDGGLSWVNLVSLYSPPQSYTSAVDYVITDPGNPGTVYVILYSGRLEKSTDGGQTWVTVAPDFGAVGPLVIDPQDSATLYCGGSNYGVFRSTDAGASWTGVGSGLNGSRLRGIVRSLTLNPQDPRTLYAGTDNGLFVITLQPPVARRPRH